MSDSRYKDLFKALAFEFGDIQLLEHSLTHRSKSNKNYERLEFLGDSILGYVIAAELFRRYPNLSEGKLTRLRAAMVRKETLAELARELQLGNYLNLGSGELKSGGHDRDSILADALEAIFGAVLLDSGMESAQSVILELYSDILKTVSPDNLKMDPKTRLQEYLQKHMQVLPEYQTVKVTGAPHAQQFVVECKVPGLSESVTGEARSRRAAEQIAAQNAYQLITKSKNADSLS